MTEESTTTIIEQPAFDDAIAARGEAILRMCVAYNQIRDKDVRAALLRGVDRIIASIPVAQGAGATVSPIPGSRRP